VCFDGSGHVVPGATDPSLTPIGIVAKTQPASATAPVPVLVHLFTTHLSVIVLNDDGNPVTDDDVGNFAFLVDSQTVSRDPAELTRPLAGRIWGLVNGGAGVEVEFLPDVALSVVGMAGVAAALAAHEADTSNPHDTTAAQVGAATPADVAVVQADIDAHELDVSNPHAVTAAQVGAPPTSRQVIAGTGLTGGGSLAADRTFACSFGTTSGSVCQGNDSRLSDSRTPTAHKTSHATGGTDALAASDIGAVATSRQVIAGTGLTGGGDLSADRTLTVAYGTSSTTACVGNDSRLSDSRTPTTHASSHASGGSDPVANVIARTTGASTGQAASNSTTYADVVSLTTPALTGTYKVSWTVFFLNDTAGQVAFTRVRNDTDGVNLEDERYTSTQLPTANTAWAYVAFTGAAKTFKIQNKIQSTGNVVTHNPQIEVSSL